METSTVETPAMNATVISRPQYQVSHSADSLFVTPIVLGKNSYRRMLYRYYRLDARYTTYRLIAPALLPLEHGQTNRLTDGNAN